MRFKFLMSLLCLITFSTYTYAQSGGQFEISKSVISNSDTKMSGGVFELDGTVGQIVAGKVTASQFEVNGGFWPVSSINDLIFRDGFELSFLFDENDQVF